MSTERNRVAEIAVSYSADYKKKIRINNVADAAKILRNMWDVNLLTIQEQFCVLYLNNQNEVNGFRCLSTGTINETVVDLRLLLGIACKSLSSKIIIAHNHPSGTKEISPADMMLTQKVKKGCKSLGIELLDHIILTPNDFVSFANVDKL